MRKFLSLVSVCLFCLFPFSQVLRADEALENALRKEIELLTNQDFRLREKATQNLARLIGNGSVFDTSILKTLDAAIHSGLPLEATERLESGDVAQAILWQEIGVKAADLKNKDAIARQLSIAKIEDMLLALGGFAVRPEQIDALFAVLHPGLDPQSNSAADNIVLREVYNERCKTLPRLAWIWSYWLAKNAYFEIERNIRSCPGEEKKFGGHYWKAIAEQLEVIKDDTAKKKDLMTHINLMAAHFSDVGPHVRLLLQNLLPSQGDLSNLEITTLASLWQCQEFDIEAISRFVTSLLAKPELNFENYHDFRGNHFLFKRIQAKRDSCPKEFKEALLKVLVEGYRKIAKEADFKAGYAASTLALTHMKLFVLAIGMGDRPTEEEWKFFLNLFSDIHISFFVEGLQTIFKSFGILTPSPVKHDVFISIGKRSKVDQLAVLEALLPLLHEQRGPLTKEITDVIVALFADAQKAPGVTLAKRIFDLKVNLMPQRIIDALSVYEESQTVPMLAIPELVKK